MNYRPVPALPPARGNAARWAVFSEDGQHRFLLCRRWVDITTAPTLVLVGLNPSDADEVKDDPTIRKDIGFAKRYGCGGILKVNLSSFVTPYPRELRQYLKARCSALRHSENHQAIAWALATLHGCGTLRVAAWGNLDNRLTTHLQESLVVARGASGGDLYCFGKTKLECPRHPGRIAYSTPLVHLDTGKPHPRVPIHLESSIE